MTKNIRRSLAITVATLGALALAVPAYGQEVEPAPATMGGEVPKGINVSQDQLTKADSDSRNWLHTQRQLRPDPLLPRQPDQHAERQEA